MNRDISDKWMSTGLDRKVSEVVRFFRNLLELNDCTEENELTNYSELHWPESKMAGILSFEITGLD